MRSADVFLALLHTALVVLSTAFRKKETRTSVSNENPPFTRLHFELPQNVKEPASSFLEQSVMTCGVDTPSPYWTKIKRKRTMDLLSTPSGDKAWDAELKVLLKEPAIEQVWSEAMEVWDCSVTSLASKANALLSNEVPGLGGVTFQTVFATLQEEGCPVWILGGSPRDLISGKTPKDVDTSALCQVTKIQKILSKKGWKVYINRNYKYYEVGTRGAEDGMEGKSIDALYTDPSIIDWTANMLLLDPIRMYVVDPSGRGIADAKNFRLTPATPPPFDWDAWLTWKEQETQPRYYRYLKFRLRDWQPYDDCFRYFMANEIVAALQKELTDPHNQMPMWLFLTQQLEDESKRMTIHKYLMHVLEQDLTRGYFEKDDTCNATAAVAKSTLSQGSKSGLRIFHETLVNGCKAPPDPWNDIAKKKRVDLSIACSLIRDFYKWARGGAYITFKKGDAVFFKTKRGVLLEGIVGKSYETRKQIDWSYEIVNKEGEMIQANATAKRVLGRQE